MKLRTAAAIWAALSLLLLVLVWIVPAKQAPEETVFNFGAGKNVSWIASSSRSTTVRLTTNLELDSAHVSVVPSLFVDGEGVDPDEAELSLWTTVYANGESIYSAVMGIHAVGGFVSWEPCCASKLDQDRWKAGSNEIVVEASLHLKVKQPTDKRITFTIGPVKTFVRETDFDNDGIPDTQQPVTGVHTGWVWFVACAATAVLVFGVWGWRKRRKDP